MTKAAVSRVRTAQPREDKPRDVEGIVGRDGQPLARKRRNNTDPFYIDPSVIPDGWRYQWCRNSVAGEIDTANMIAHTENGWRPVPAERHPGMFMVDGHKGPIERGGLILMERPSALCAEAEMEELQLAADQRRSQQEVLGIAMPTGFSVEHPRAQPVVNRSREQAPAAEAMEIED